MRYHKRMFSLRNICAKKTWHFLFSFSNRIIFYNHIKFKDFEMVFFPHLLADAAGSTTRVMAGWTVTSGPSLCRLWRHVIPPPRNVNARVSIPTFVAASPSSAAEKLLMITINLDIKWCFIFGLQKNCRLPSKRECSKKSRYRNY